MSNIITTTGLAKIAAAIANATTLDITHIALGSSDRFPTGGESALESEVYRDLVSESGLVDGSPNEAYFKFTVPEDGVEPGFDYGPWLAQEVGLFDSDGDLIVIGRFPEPLPKYDPASGSPNALHINVRVIFASIEAINVTYQPEFNLPWATDPQFADDTTEGRVAQVKQIHNLFATKGLLQNNLVYPEVETATGKLGLAYNGDGTSTFNADQSWLWRGMLRFSTDDFIAADRTVTHVANKTYHVRWHAPGTGDAVPEATYPSGRFVLKDLADVGYNPSVLIETDPAFDTTYDDMLIARIITDGANAPVNLWLANKASLVAEVEISISNFGLQEDIPPSQVINGPYIQLDFARTPKAMITGFTDVTASVSGDEIGAGSEINIGANVLYRYGVILFYQRTAAAGLGFVGAVAWA